MGLFLETQYFSKSRFGAAGLLRDRIVRFVPSAGRATDTGALPASYRDCQKDRPARYIGHG